MAGCEGLMGLSRPSRITIAIPNVATKKVRMETSKGDTVQISVLPPPIDLRVTYRRLWWALPMLTLSALVFVLVIGSSLIQISYWETAPGEAASVADRMSITAAKRYPAENKLMFVTAYGSQLTGLESLVGWIDPDVDIYSRTERFGRTSPTGQRRAGFQAMTSAKQIAEYVAFKHLGYDVSIKDGVVLVNDLVCEVNPAPDSACNVLEIGDLINAVDGQATATLPKLAEVLGDHAVGDVLSVEVTPYGEANKETRKIRMIESPSEPGRAILGFVPADTRIVQLPFEVEIDTDSIGGPSAGLAFTLSLIDELSKGELLGKTTVAVTGTIEDDGTVGAIGALQQKAVAVERSGAEVFIVPSEQSASEMTEARAAVGSGLKIVQVANLDEALKVLLDLGGEPINKGIATGIATTQRSNTLSI